MNERLKEVNDEMWKENGGNWTDVRKHVNEKVFIDCHDDNL